MANPVEALVGPPKSRRQGPSGDIERIFSRRQIEQAFLQVFHMVGGVPKLADWANSNEANYREFLRLLPAILPRSTLQEIASVIEIRSNVPESPLNRCQEAFESEDAVVE